MRFTAVLFDMGGTLLGYERRDKLGGAFIKALRGLGIDPADPEVITARTTAAAEVETRYAEVPFFLHRDLFRERLIRTVELLGRTSPDEVLSQFDRDQREAVIEHLTPMPRVHETLRTLRESGVYVAVVSNADDDYMVPVLARNGLADLLDDWTSSEEANSCKPHRGIFDYAIRKGGVTAESTLFVGDSPEHDVAGAQRVGLKTALIGDPRAVAPLSTGLDSAEPTWQIHDLWDLIEIVNPS